MNQATFLHPLKPENLLHGNCIFTISNPAGERYTIRIKASKPTEQFPTPGYFVSYLAGPDNETNYVYLGMLRDGNLHRTTKSPVNNKVFGIAMWCIQHINKHQPFPPGYELRPSGRCCRCGRTLTVPSSIDANIGPECASKL